MQHKRLTMPSVCIFCEISRKLSPETDLDNFEDEAVFPIFSAEACFSILDIQPSTRAHTLIISRHHYETFDELPRSVAGAIGACLPQVARAVQHVSGVESYNLLANNGARAGQVHNLQPWLIQ